MKKPFLSSFFTMTIAFCAMVMFSCGDKKTETPATEGQDAKGTTEQVEQQEEQATESQTATDSGLELLAEDKTFDMESFSVTIPKGWKQPSEGHDRVSSILPAEDYKNTFKYLKSFTITCLKTAVDKKIEQDKKTLGANSPVTEGADLTVNGATWKVLKKEQADGQPTFIYTSAGENKCIYASIENVGTDDAEIKAIIESVKIK